MAELLEKKVSGSDSFSGTVAGEEYKVICDNNILLGYVDTNSIIYDKDLNIAGMVMQGGEPEVLSVFKHEMPGIIFTTSGSPTCTTDVGGFLRTRNEIFRQYKKIIGIGQDKYPPGY